MAQVVTLRSPSTINIKWDIPCFFARMKVVDRIVSEEFSPPGSDDVLEVILEKPGQGEATDPELDCPIVYMGEGMSTVIFRGKVVIKKEAVKIDKPRSGSVVGNVTIAEYKVRIAGETEKWTIYAKPLTIDFEGEGIAYSDYIPDVEQFVSPDETLSVDLNIMYKPSGYSAD